MKTRAAGFLLAGITLLCPVAAQAVAPGAPTCGQWVKEPDAGDKVWLLGSLSDVAVASNRNFLDGVDRQSIFLWIDN